MIIKLEDLKPLNMKEPEANEDGEIQNSAKNAFFHKFNYKQGEPDKYGEIPLTKKYKFEYTDIPEDTEDNTRYHKNYIEYLEASWGAHRSVIISPEIVWYTLLCEIATAVKNNPESFRKLFSKSDKKVDIEIYTENNIMPLDDLMMELKKRVPMNMDLFFPELESIVSGYSLASFAAFADAVSPFYSYWIKACGIPEIEILGAQKEWELLVTNWELIMKTFDLKELEEWGKRVSNTLKDISKMPTAVDFWKDMFYLKRCGSGSQQEIFGWFTKLFKTETTGKRSTNFPTHSSTVLYTKLETNEKFKLSCGLFSSKDQNGKLVPSFNTVVVKEID